MKNLIKEAFATGATVEEAIANAKAALNAPEDVDVIGEIIEMPAKKGLLGLFGSTPAKARAYYEYEEQTAMKKAVEYLMNILKGMGMDAKANAREEGDDIIIDLDCGDDHGIVIGRRGETLDAIQYLTRLVVNRGSDNYKRVSINIGDYREKREKALIGLAHKNAAKVAKYGRNITLEPMNPFERRIIHTAVQDVEGVTSHSVGSDADRRVVITLKEGVKPTNPSKGRGGYNKGGYNKGRGGYNKGRGGSRGGSGRSSRNDSAPVNTESRAPRTDAGAASVSRYGKIN